MKNSDAAYLRDASAEMHLSVEMQYPCSECLAIYAKLNI